MPSSQLTIIGCGVFGRLIATGLSDWARGTFTLALTHRRPDAVRRLAVDYPEALVTGDNEDPRLWKGGGTGRHVVIVATQPQFTQEVCGQIRRAVKAAGGAGAGLRSPVVVTLCPGITVAQLESWLHPAAPIVRTMPNTPVSVRQGATALFPNRHVTPDMAAEVRAIFQGMSPTTVVLPQEDLLDIVASISGSAPAYIFHVMQSLVAAGAARGLPAELGRQLVVQSCLGSAVLAQTQSDVTLLQLLADVCVAGGSTEKAVFTLDRLGADRAVREAVDASWHANRAMGGGGEAASPSE